VPADRDGEVHGAELFRPEVVFRHVGEPPERPQTPGHGDLPAGFLEHFAVERGDRMFAPVDPAARQLQLGHRLGLMRRKDVVAPQQDGIDARPAGIAPPGFGRFAEASDHFGLLEQRLP